MNSERWASNNADFLGHHSAKPFPYQWKHCFLAISNWLVAFVDKTAMTCNSNYLILFPLVIFTGPIQVITLIIDYTTGQACSFLGHKWLSVPSFKSNFCIFAVIGIIIFFIHEINHIRSLIGEDFNLQTTICNYQAPLLVSASHWMASNCSY